jgi:glycosyltransferase involved in cell wall biosynthesis
MKHFFAQHPEYKIVHSHIDAMSYLPLLAAKKANIPVRIAHSHSTSIDKDLKYILKQFYRLGINRVVTHCFACGKKAGEFLFRGRDFQVIPNAVNASDFYFDTQSRAKKRKELGLTDEFTVGHIGRFYYPKNHKFLIDVFHALTRLRPDARLVLVGNGEKESEIRDYVAKYGLTDQVYFLGSRSDVADLYQAMDVFVLPSLFEGIPLVGVEAQLSGLPCLFSDKVPDEVAFGEQVSFVSLQETPAQWANRLIAEPELTRQQRADLAKNSHYDIQIAKKFLVGTYQSLLSAKEC